ncbi:hypothetical protein Ancab_034768 [Ancistrocladus abbreviatus]
MATEATTRVSLESSTNAALQSLFDALDPYSCILSHPSVSLQANNAATTTDHYFMERGPRYNAYAKLRESKLRMKMMNLESKYEIPTLELTPPPKKSVKFDVSVSGSKRSVGHSVLAQSVPDFASALRKENRKPAANLQSRVGTSTTPPLPASKCSGSKFSAGMMGAKWGGGSKSVNSGEKKSGGFVMMMAARKSCASVEELKGLSMAAANAIAGENRGGRGGGGGRMMARAGATVLGDRHW